MSGELVKRTLAECEAVIEQGRLTFIEVGEALLEIRANRLYKQTHRSFDDYCKQRWGFTRQRASQLITATEYSKVSTAVATSEGQARALRAAERKSIEGDALAEFVESDSGIRAARIRARFSKWLWQIHQSHLFDPEEIADIAADRQRDLDETVQRLEEFSAAFHRAIRSHLRVVDGGRS